MGNNIKPISAKKVIRAKNKKEKRETIDIINRYIKNAITNDKLSTKVRFDYTLNNMNLVNTICKIFSKKKYNIKAMIIHQKPPDNSDNILIYKTGCIKYTVSWE